MSGRIVSGWSRASITRCRAEDLIVPLDVRSRAATVRQRGVLPLAELYQTLAYGRGLFGNGLQDRRIYGRGLVADLHAVRVGVQADRMSKHAAYLDDVVRKHSASEVE